MSDSGADKDGAPSGPPKRRNLTALFFVLFVPLVLFAAFALNMRKEGILTCAPAYTDNYYLAYCDGSAYADFDHGAVWYGLEPVVVTNAKAADVLFLGNSRMQFGFSADAVRSWFAQKNVKPYFLGFSHDENVTFARPLVEKLKPGARAYVINIDDFFIDAESPPGADVMHSESTRARYDRKREWQIFHREVCPLPVIGKICGERNSYYRNRDNGMWKRGTLYPNVEPAKPWRALPVNADEVAMAKQIAPAFIAKLGVPAQCVILTYVPTADNDIETARAIAGTLGLKFVSPLVPGLSMFDGSHLDPPSAERFSQAFMEQAGPVLESCAAGKAL